MSLRTLSIGSVPVEGTLSDTHYVVVRTGSNETDWVRVFLSDFQTYITEDVNVRIDNLEGSIGGGSGPSNWPIPRTFSLSGPVTGSVSFDGSSDISLTTSVTDGSLTIAKVAGLQTAIDGRLASNANAVSASRLQTARTISLTGVTTGSGNFDGSANLEISTSIADNTLSIAKTIGLQTNLDAKANLAGGAQFSGLVSHRFGSTEIWAAASNTDPLLHYKNETGLSLASLWYDRASARVRLTRFNASGNATQGEVSFDATKAYWNDQEIYHTGNLSTTSFNYLSVTSTVYASGAGVNCNDFASGTKALVHNTNTNTPGTLSPFWYVETLCIGSDSTTLLQRAWSNSADESYFRRCEAGVWGSWRRNWNASNFNPDSKLNSNANAVSATALQTARTFSLSGAITSASFSFNGTQNVDIVTNLADASLSLAKLANITTNRLMGRSSAGTGAVELIQIGSGLTLSGGILSASGSASSLVNWTEGLNNTSPNVSQPVVFFSPNNAAANVDVVISPKGSGDLIAAIPDNTITGGNKRGGRSVDWQRSRSASDRVASGAWSVIGGGSNNAALGSFSTVAGGESNSAGDIGSTVAGGRSNNASGLQAFIGSGDANAAAGPYAGVLCGQNNSASGTGAAILNGRENAAAGAYSAAMGMRASTRSIVGAFARGVAFSSSAGASQAMQLQLGGSTTNATATALTSNYSGAGTTNQMVLPNSSVYVVRGTVAARESTTGAVAGWHFDAVVSRGTGVGTVSIVSNTVSSTGASAGATAWTIQLVADTTNGALRVNAVGEASKSINWTVDIYSSAQVVF
jgi:hypothetical protein